jgi:hypothetical protein
MLAMLAVEQLIQWNLPTPLALNTVERLGVRNSLSKNAQCVKNRAAHNRHQVQLSNKKVLRFILFTRIRFHIPVYFNRRRQPA